MDLAEASPLEQERMCGQVGLCHGQSGCDRKWSPRHPQRETWVTDLAVTMSAPETSAGQGQHWHPHPLQFTSQSPGALLATCPPHSIFLITTLLLQNPPAVSPA